MIPEQYGRNYQQHLLEQYKLYVEMADRVSQRRATANTFFLTLQTGLFGLAISLAGLSSGQMQNQIAALVASIFGIGFAFVWLILIRSYRQINSSKYAVLNDIEEKLPASLYKDEWIKLDRGENKRTYIPLTSAESGVPILFTLGYIAAGAFAVYLMKWG